MNNIDEIKSYKSRGFKYKIFITISILLVSMLGYYFFTQKNIEEKYSYVTQPLKKSDFTLTVSASGYLEPVETVDVGTEISGTIEHVYVDSNDVVKKGQVLAQLNKTKYKSALNQAEASLEAANASLENMNAQLYESQAIVNRNKNLREITKNTLPSQSDWDRDWAKYLTNKAQVASAKAQINQAKQILVSSKYDLERSIVYSPIDGIVLVRNIDPGQTVAASFQTPVLFKIAKDLTKMELQVNIDEADIAKVSENQTATFSVDAYPNKNFDAHVKLVRVNSEMIDGVVTYKAQLTVENEQLLLKPGMSADADIITQMLNSAFVVPKASLLYVPIDEESDKDKTKILVDKKPHIWVLKDKKPKKVYVQLLGSNGSNTAIASEELQEDDLLITTQEIRK